MTPIEFPDTRLRSAFRESPFAMMLINEAGRIIESSSSSQQLFGYQQQDNNVPLIHELPLLSNEDRIFLKEIITKLVRSEIMIEGELRIKGEKNDYQKIHVTATRLSRTQKLFMFLFTYKDIALQMTIEKELRDTERHYKELLESSPYAIMIVDRVGIVIDYNEHVRTLLGKEVKEYIGEHIDTLVLPFIKEKRLCISRFTRTFRGEITKSFKITVNSDKGNTHFTRKKR
jgi:PAS domain S-box-containing protein